MAKNRSSLVVIVGVLVLLGLALALGACDNSGAGGDSGYVVRFTVDDTDYVLTEGYTVQDAFDSGANGSLSTGGAFIRMGAVGTGVSTMATEGPYIFISVSGNATGTYISTDVDIGIFFGEAQEHYTIDGGMSGPPPDPRTVTITAFSESLGGTIEGTFSGTLNGGAGTIEITDGSFVVERLSDGAVEVPGIFE